jgi:hypothetical protein
VATRVHEPAATQAAPRSTGNVDADLARLRSLVEDAPITEARAFVEHLLEVWPESERVRRCANILEPPKPTASPELSGAPIGTEREWLKTHRHEYPGCWIAVRGDRLILAHPDLREVHRAIRQAGNAEGTVIYYQGGHDCLNLAHQYLGA